MRSQCSELQFRISGAKCAWLFAKRNIRSQVCLAVRKEDCLWHHLDIVINLGSDYNQNLKMKATGQNQAATLQLT
jgi:hypothetical protein